jgi:hypothetical protein
MLKAGGRVIEELGDKAEPSALAKQVYNAMQDAATEEPSFVSYRDGVKFYWFMTQSEAALALILLLFLGFLALLKVVPLLS